MVLDEIVFQNYYTYMMHINYMDYSQDEMKDRFLETMKHFKFHRYIATEERGTVKGELHLQCCLWHQNDNLKREKILDYRFTKQRRHKTGKNAKRKTTQASFAHGKKDTLASYSLKDFTSNKTRFIVTNLSKKEFKLIPKWIDLKDEKKAFNIALHKYCQEVGKETHPSYEHNIIEFYEQILVFYKEQEQRAFPTRKRLYDLALKYHDNYGYKAYLKDIGILRELIY